MVPTLIWQGVRTDAQLAYAYCSPHAGLTVACREMTSGLSAVSFVTSTEASWAGIPPLAVAAADAESLTEAILQAWRGAMRGKEGRRRVADFCLHTLPSTFSSFVSYEAALCPAQLSDRDARLALVS